MKTKTIAIVVMTLALALGAGCKKKGDKAAAKDGKAAEADKGGDKGGAAPAGPLKLAAADLWKDYSSRQGADLMDHYQNGVIVNGSVKQVMDATEMEGSFDVWLDVDGTKWISLGFKDGGKGAKAKGIKQGDAVTAQCSVGGMDGDNKYMMMTDCELK